MIEKCPDCKNDFPSHLIHPFIFNIGNAIKTVNVCPICALKRRNKQTGLPEDTPFSGLMAGKLYEEAKEYLKKKDK